MNERLKLSDDKSYIVSIGLVLILVSSLVIGYYLITRLPPEGYTTIYLLDPQKKAIDYPELLVTNYNDTLNVWVKVENHMGEALQFDVRLKVISGTISALPVEIDPTNSYVKTLEKDESWEINAKTTINIPGNYSVAYELWICSQGAEEFEFTHNYCVLNIEVVDQI